VEREQQLEQAQRDFFSAVSHELKTPITVMKGQLGGMLDGIGVYADRDKYLARSMAVANQMESLVQELLTVSRMERGGELSMIPVELTALIRNCLQNYDELFQQKKQTVIADLPSEIWSAGDLALLKKALGNLLSNAALHSPVGIKIWISARRKEDNIILNVENEGAHIAPEQLPHLFEPFFRSDPSRSRQTGGSGLGLYLVQKIAERHGGSCQIQNSARGVCATLILPNSTQTTY
jgi:two-component system sensor histidine kinase VanS